MNPNCPISTLITARIVSGRLILALKKRIGLLLVYNEFKEQKKTRAFARVKGFTLIEILVAITVIGILSGVGIASYQNYNRRQILSQTAQDLANTLRFAQDKALSGEKDCASAYCGGGDGACDGINDKNLRGWYVVISQNQYEIYGYCGDIKFSSKTTDLSARKITLSPFPNEFLFKPLGSGVSNTGGWTVTLRNVSNNTVVVSVTVTGEIKVSE